MGGGRLRRHGLAARFASQLQRRGWVEQATHLPGVGWSGWSGRSALRVLGAVAAVGALRTPSRIKPSCSPSPWPDTDSPLPSTNFPNANDKASLFLRLMMMPRASPVGPSPTVSLSITDISSSVPVASPFGGEDVIIAVERLTAEIFSLDSC